MKQNQKKEENQTGQYKQKIQNYIKHQQRNPRKQNLTIDKILTQMIIDSLNLKDNEKFIFNIFDDIKQPLWSYQISKQMLNKIINKNDKIQTIILYSLLITDGYFNFKSKKVNLIYVKVPQVFIYQSFFLLQSTDNFCLLFEVGIHKSVNDSKKQTQDICFDISQKITFIDIFFYQKGQEITEAILEYQRNNFKNFYRSELNQIECISIPLTGTNAKQQSYLFQIEKNSWPESTYQLKDSKSTQWIPLSFKQLIEQKQNMLFQGKFMKISFHKNITNQYLYEEIGNQNKYKLTQFADFNSAGQILDLLSKSQHFKIKLSDQERQIVIAQNNALVIGRSGTGKTTSIVLKIFATEMLVKVRSKLFGQKRIQFLQDYQGQEVQIHSIFSTANKFLVQEVEKYYHKLELQAQDAIKKHRISKTFNLDESFVSINESVISNYESDILDFLLQEDLQNNIQQEQSSKFDNQNLNPKSFQTSDFPGFFSTEQILILLDKQSQQPFFSVEKIIKFRHKHQDKVGFQDFNGINLDEWFSQPKNQYQNQSQSFSSNFNKKNDTIVPEVDFMLFYLQFWPNVARKRANNYDNIALPSLVWTQIYSYIKGSQYSYLYPNRCLPFQLYKQRVESFLTEQQIEEVYDCFKNYERWKEKEQFIDQLDIINSLLNNIEQNQLNRFPIHYSYIDEVQDLPQAMIELFCKITEQGVIFCGDTAQSILKGVGFRFSDLQTIFKTSRYIGSNELEKFQVYQLTKNFRSHNSILQLANCIIIILELLFPNSLDHLQKEVSNLKGPKPLIISNNNPNLILDYLNEVCDAEKFCDVELGYNQVIIVKNQEAKEALPYTFKSARVLTIYQAKGLEFDDVILYNCFTSDPIPQQQWSFLSCLDVDEAFIDKQVFEESITKHQENNDNNDSELGKNEQYVIQKKLKLNQKYDKKQANDYSSLCNELKMLYVCITRAKKRVVIYDDQPAQRQYLERILKRFNVCDFIHEYGQIQKIIQKRQELLKTNQQIQQKEQDQQEQQDKLSKENWEAQGNLMFQKKLYDEAEKCFQKCGNIKMEILSSAFKMASRGSQKLGNYKSYLVQYKQTPTLFLKKKVDHLEQELRKDFESAARIFLNPQLNDYYQAANCYYSGMMYENSTILFLNFKYYPQAAKSAKKSNEIMLSVIIYYKLGRLEKVVKLLQKYQLNEFFKYKVLKQCLFNNFLNKEQVKQLLLNQQYEQQNIFNQLDGKYKSINNDEIDKEKFVQLNFSKNILDQIAILDLFDQELNAILDSQIYINNDLEEMMFLQLKVFLNLYFEIIDQKMIMNYYSEKEISSLFEGEKIIINQLSQQFAIEVLEQLKQYQILTTLYPKRQLFYCHFTQCKYKQIEINDVTLQSLIYGEMSILELLFLDQIEILRNIIKDKDLDQKQQYLEFSQILLSKEQILNIQNENLFLIKNYYLLGYYSQYQNEKNKQMPFQNYMMNLINNQFCNRFNLFFIFHSLIQENKELDQENIKLLFKIENQKEQFMIILHFFYYEQERFFKKFIINFNFQQKVFVWKLIAVVINLFKVDYEDTQYQNNVFLAICSLFGCYVSESKFLNIFDSSLIFQFQMNTNQDFSFQESIYFIQKIQDYIDYNNIKIFLSLFEDMVQNKQYKNNSQYQLLKQEKNHHLIEDLVFIIDQVCHEIKIDEIVNNKHIKILIKIIHFLDSLVIQIPKSVQEIINENNFGFMCNLISFHTYCKNMISLQAIDQWVKFHFKRNQCQIYNIDILNYEISQVIMILIIFYHFDCLNQQEIYLNQQMMASEIKYITIADNQYKKINSELIKQANQKQSTQSTEQNLQQNQNKVISDLQSADIMNETQTNTQIESNQQQKTLDLQQEKKNVKDLVQNNQMNTQLQNEQSEQNLQQNLPDQKQNEQVIPDHFFLFQCQHEMLQSLSSFSNNLKNEILIDGRYDQIQLDQLLEDVYLILIRYIIESKDQNFRMHLHHLLILLNENLLLLKLDDSFYKIILDIIDEELYKELEYLGLINDKQVDQNFNQISPKISKQNESQENQNQQTQDKQTYDQQTQDKQTQDQQKQDQQTQDQQTQDQKKQDQQTQDKQTQDQQTQDQLTQDQKKQDQQTSEVQKIDQDSSNFNYLIQKSMQNFEEKEFIQSFEILTQLKAQIQFKQNFNYQIEGQHNINLQFQKKSWNCLINFDNYNQLNYQESNRNKITGSSCDIKEQYLKFLDFRNIKTKTKINNKQISEIHIRIDKLKKLLRKSIQEIKQQGASYSLFKDFVFILKKVSDLDYELQQKKNYDEVKYEIDEIIKRLKQNLDPKQKKDQILIQLSKIMAQL